MLAHAKGSAKAKGLDFNLTLEDIVIPETCPVLGIRLEPSWSDRSPGHPSLDRIDNAKGYIRGNVAVISWRANQLKRDGSLAELEAIVAWMRNASTS